MKLHFSEVLPVTPAVAWRLVTDPEAMNLWSEARIKGVSEGDGGGYDGVGAIRVVNVPVFGRRTSKLKEVITVSEPPSRLVYRVFDSPPITGHRGMIELSPHDDSTRIKWTVEASFVPASLGVFAKRLLQSKLGQSIRQMKRIATTAGATPTQAFSRQRILTADLADGYRRAEEILKQQTVLADRLFETNDPKRWFSRVYQYVTEAQISACRAGRFAQPAWVLDVIVAFHGYYIDNFSSWLRGQRGETEAHWIRAFSVMEGTSSRRHGPKTRLLLGLMLAMVAHIEDDLPRALSEVYLDRYRNQCDYVRFRGDYILMAGVFDTASARLLREMPTQFVPWYMRLPESELLNAVNNRMIRRRFYDIPRARMTAFERGGRLSKLLLKRLPR